MLRSLSVLLAALPLASAGPLFLGSFDGPNHSWTVLRGAATPDSSVLHDNRKALRVEASGDSDACVRSAPVTLVIGKRYEVSGWVRTDNLGVRDSDRAPVAIGAALQMASMPFDVHSESVGGTRDWTHLALRFTASKANDNILLTAGLGGSLRGKAWFEGVSVDEVSAQDGWPVRSAIKTYGPAYRYPPGGWIYLHIEGAPYERGYQHGFLMAKEIPLYLARCAADIDGQGREKSWDVARGMANALFLRGFDEEILQEMKGIADGASAAGATWQNRKIDLIDIVTANTTVELGELREALPMTPTGLESLHLTAPHYSTRDVPLTARCSAFAATGKATRDGKMVIAHLTMWPLTLAEQTNVMIDVKPVSGHRVLMQSYPGGIESGTDWYGNDAGVILTETTIRQSPFNAAGTPVAYRARNAIQYGDDVDGVVARLAERNNGLYTNEWLIGDAKNNEVAMFELGTYKTKLWRSSKNEWFGGTEGFYWGCNNAKDLAVRLEYAPDPHGEPQYLPYAPGPRDIKWQELYASHRGQIDEQFAFLAMRTAPLVSSTTFDAKVTNSDMASRMMVWAQFGKPNGREWTPSERQKENYRGNEGIYASGYRLLSTEAPAALNAPAAPPARSSLLTPKSVSPAKSQLWKGWILPASSSDVWLSAGAAAYFEDLQSSNVDDAVKAEWAEYRRAGAEAPNGRQAYERERAGGAIFLDSLRRKMGDERFFPLMRDFFSAHSTQAVSASEFLTAAEVPFAIPADPGGPMYLPRDISSRFATALIVYGTTTEAGGNRYAAEHLQKRLLDFYESEVPLRKDFEATPEELRAHDVIFIGRPETNSALAAWMDRLHLAYNGAEFHAGSTAHPSETEGLMMAAGNPLDAHHMVLVLAGNSAIETVRLTGVRPGATEYAVYDGAHEQ